MKKTTATVRGYIWVYYIRKRPFTTQYVYSTKKTEKKENGLLKKMLFVAHAVSLL